MHPLRQHIPFFSSVFLGILVWLLVFLLFPAKVVNPLAWETLLFIVLSYLALVLGYILIPQKSKSSVENKANWNRKRIYILVTVVIGSFVIRYIDLFLIRGVSFEYDVWQNRQLLEKTKPGFLLIFFSISKQLYFIPIILLFAKKIKDQKLLIVSILLFALPFAEGIIRGSRNSFFIPVVLLFFIFLYFKKIHFKKRQILVIAITTVLLFLIATSIIIGREKSRTDENYSSITTEFLLNDFLQPSAKVFKKINNTESKTVKKLMVSGFQIGQYYVHGVFEFDYLMKHYKKTPLEPQYGKYMFATVNRFTNKCGLTNTSLELVKSKHPRGFTFITFFGSLFIDFGWFGIFVMFLFGALQKRISNAVQMQKTAYVPLFIFFLFVNFFMLTFNFIENTGTYFITVCIGFMLFSNQVERGFTFFSNKKPD